MEDSRSAPVRVNTNVSRILVPVDFSAASRQAMRYALALGRKFAATVHLLHVYPRFPYVTPDMMVAFGAAETPSTPLLEFVHGEAAKDLDRFLDEATRDSPGLVTGRLEMGDPYRTIVDVARDGQYDLIVMGTHGRRGLSRVFLGSVAERVVRGAPCPVLTVRAGADAPVESRAAA